MINRYTGEVSIDLAGRRWTLLYDYDALCAVVAINDGFQLLFAVADRETLLRYLAVNQADLPGVLAAGLRRHHPEITPAAAKALLAPGYQTMAGAMADALWASLSDPDPDEAHEPDPRKAARQGGTATRFGRRSWMALLRVFRRTR